MKNEIKTAAVSIEPVIREIVVNAPTEKVWKAITDKNEMKNWYFDLAEFKPETGFEFQFLAGPDEKQYLHICRITEVIENRKLTYSWRYDGYPGTSYVTFELFSEGSEKTRLKLTHKGLETFGTDNPDLARENFETGWNDIIENSLKNYMEKDEFVAKAEITINVSSAKVWEALTSPHLIKKYLFGTDVTTDWKVGSPITYHGEWQGKAYEDKGKILKVEPQKLLVSSYWSSLAGLTDSPENYKTVTYELSEQGNKTNLRVIQDNNRSQAEADHSKQNWEIVLSKLKELLEHEF